MTIRIRLVWCVTTVACKECIKPGALRPPTPHLLVSSPLLEDKDAQNFLLFKSGVNFIFYLLKVLVSLYNRYSSIKYENSGRRFEKF